jgi:hypothetical protein
VPFGGSVVEVAADPDCPATTTQDTTVAATATVRTNNECRITAASYEAHRVGGLVGGAGRGW